MLRAVAIHRDALFADLHQELSILRKLQDVGIA